MHIIETGNVAAALGVKLAGVQVVAAYPITPQTPLTEKLSEFIEAGEMTARYVPVESEHSALAVCIAASQMPTTGPLATQRAASSPTSSKQAITVPASGVPARAASRSRRVISSSRPGTASASA